ncbi:MAG: STAS domain-containing protein [Alphaproteobacteria bacterium]|nr:STAS domain-containing protein [Alphaproteobacteria bacterium]MBU1517139.1 STAS domain-containing protein [Alphaproteobacteria bacterium]MBU2096528.1 STAS domain-containing protein [Alphaproteobacteria bacterium]MBU2151680.1 STAS domain-containing protein [Alphaproteobacteria bacterium]MBU2305442.1 STAS domain-containing protein [Alphaproteobacteria bacterium]
MAFSGPATIPHVIDAWTRLSAAVAAGGDLVVDIAEVTAADLSFVQLIEAARASCARQGGTVRLAQPAEGALRDVLDRGGFLAGADTDRLQFWTYAGVA